MGAVTSLLLQLLNVKVKDMMYKIVTLFNFFLFISLYIFLFNKDVNVQCTLYIAPDRVICSFSSVVLGRGFVCLTHNKKLHYNLDLINAIQSNAHTNTRDPELHLHSMEPHLFQKNTSKSLNEAYIF